MYILETREHVDRVFRKLSRRNADEMESIGRKIQEILEDPHRFKPMHFPLAGMRRVHIGNFVLLFSIDERRKTVILEDYEHRDRVYRT